MVQVPAGTDYLDSLDALSLLREIAAFLEAINKTLRALCIQMELDPDNLPS